MQVAAAVGSIPLKVGIANKRLAAAWNKDYRCRLMGLKPKPVWMQSPCGQGRLAHMSSHAPLLPFPTLAATITQGNEWKSTERTGSGKLAFGTDRSWG